MTSGNGAPRIVVREPNRTALVLVVAESLEIGRECSGLLLRDSSISRRHLLVEPRAGGLFVTDLDSRNGSTVGSQALRPRQRLDVGETVGFGACTLTSLGSRRTASPRRAEVRDATVDATLQGVAAAPSAARLELVATQASGICAVVAGEACDEPERRRDLGPARWQKTSEVHRRLVRGMVRRNHGVEAWTQGDGFIICFHSASTAIEFARDLHGATAAYEMSNPQVSRRMRIAIDLVDGTRLGTDQPWPDRNDTSDDAPLRVVRLCQAARAGETLIGASVHEMMHIGRAPSTPTGLVRFREFGEEYLFHVLVS